MSSPADNSADEEVVLKGGRANTGQVVRIGAQVARPTYPQTPTVEHFLRHLHASDVGFVPKPLGSDDLGRQRLSFLPGDAPTPPYPDWAFDEQLLVDVARHQRRMHQAASSYVAPADAVWAVSAGDYFPTAATSSDTLVVCHNDIGMTNVIVTADRQFSGFIDFDYCRPVDRLFDIAVAARHWAPFGDLDLGDEIELDRLRRFSLFCDAHELTSGQRHVVVELAGAFLVKARENIAALAAAGQGAFQELLDNGYSETNRTTVDWLVANKAALAEQ